MSKIEQGQADASADIIDRLFAELGISYIRDDDFLLEASQHFKEFFSLWDTEQPFEKERTYFIQQGAKLENSELHLYYHLYLLFYAIHNEDMEKAENERAYLNQFISYMDDRQKVRYYMGAAKLAGNSEHAIQLLAEAARHGNNSVIYHQMATVLFHVGRYGESIEKAENADLFASEEGNPSVLIGSSFLLGSCYCNGRDLSISKKYYERAIALTRGYNVQVKSYAYYNLGTAYLSCGYYEDAEYYLSRAVILDEKPYHNVMLYQKCSVLYAQMGKREKSEEYLIQSQRTLHSIAGDTVEYKLCEKMILFAELLLNSDCMNLPEYEEVLKTLYFQTDKTFGFGFRRFYGEFLIQLYKHKRKYKDALSIKENMDAFYLG